MKYETLKPISDDNNADPHGVYGAAGAVQRKRRQKFLYVMHHVINLKEKKQKIKNKDIN